MNDYDWCFEQDGEHQCRLRGDHYDKHRCCSCGHTWSDEG
jgi:hypothetical protein